MISSTSCIKSAVKFATLSLKDDSRTKEVVDVDYVERMNLLICMFVLQEIARENINRTQMDIIFTRIADTVAEVLEDMMRNYKEEKDGE